MADFTFTDSVRFPAGTTVGVYEAQNIPAEIADGDPPPGSPITSGVMTATGVTFTGLVAGGAYQAVGLVGSRYMYTGFSVPGTTTDPAAAFLDEDEVISGEWRFNAVPAIHGADDSDPVYLRTSTDGKTDGQWNVVFDAVAGHGFHITSGANAASNPGGAAIGIGVTHGVGILVQNYGTDNATGIALNQLASVAESDSNVLQVSQSSNTAPATDWLMENPGTQPLMNFASASGVAAGTQHITVRDLAYGGSNLAGQIGAAEGKIDWRRNIEAIAANSSYRPVIKVADEVATYPTKTYMTGVTNGDAGLRIFKNAAGSGSIGWQTKIVMDSLSGGNPNYLKFIMTDGAYAEGAEVWEEIMTLAGTVGAEGGFSVFGQTPVTVQTVGAAATDPATTMALVNLIRTALVNFGFCKT